MSGEGGICEGGAGNDERIKGTAAGGERSLRSEKADDRGTVAAAMMVEARTVAEV
jgi:hypothetical protein